MQRSSKSIVVKQQGGRGTLAACPPAPRTQLAPGKRRPEEPQPPPPPPPPGSLCCKCLRYALSTLQLTLYILVKYI